MQHSPTVNGFFVRGKERLGVAGSRGAVVAGILGVALVAFEIFNFDTTQFALRNLLGDVSFGGIMWATILAIAFCSIDFAGLVRIFTPEKGLAEPKSVWFLTGAWFLGTLANAVMTWWAVSITLLNHDFGNEVLSREQLLRYVPLFVAALVWLTRILFIGAFSATGETLMGQRRAGGKQRTAGSGSGRASKPYVAPSTAATPSVSARQAGSPKQGVSQSAAAPRATSQAAPRPQPAPPARPVAAAPQITYEPVDDPVVPTTPPPSGGYAQPNRDASRIRQRPPMPGNSGRYPTPGGVQAQGGSNRQPRRL